MYNGSLPYMDTSREEFSFSATGSSTASSTFAYRISLDLVGFKWRILCSRVLEVRRWLPPFIASDVSWPLVNFISTCPNDVVLRILFCDKRRKTMDAWLTDCFPCILPRPTLQVTLVHGGSNAFSCFVVLFWNSSTAHVPRFRAPLFHMLGNVRAFGIASLRILVGKPHGTKVKTTFRGFRMSRTLCIVLRFLIVFIYVVFRSWLLTGTFGSAEQLSLTNRASRICSCPITFRSSSSLLLGLAFARSGLLALDSTPTLISPPRSDVALKHPIWTSLLTPRQWSVMCKCHCPC